MTHRISRFAVHRTSATIGFIYGLLGLVFWPAVFLASESEKPPPKFFLLAAPLFFGVAGYLIIAAYCALYNLVARWTGGIEFRLEPAGR